MSLVVDASVAFKWFVPEIDRGAALALLDKSTPLLAPDLIFAEIGNAMWARLRGQTEGPTAADAALKALRRVLNRVIPASEFASRAVEIAFELKHPVYDCIYLACCESESLQLATADERLADSVRGTSFEKHIMQWK